MLDLLILNGLTSSKFMATTTLRASSPSSVQSFEFETNTPPTETVSPSVSDTVSDALSSIFDRLKKLSIQFSKTGMGAASPSAEEAAPLEPRNVSRIGLYFGLLPFRVYNTVINHFTKSIRVQIPKDDLDLLHDSSAKLSVRYINKLKDLVESPEKDPTCKVMSDLCVLTKASLSNILENTKKIIDGQEEVRLAVPVILSSFADHIVTVFIEKKARQLTIDYYDSHGLVASDLDINMRAFSEDSITIGVFIKKLRDCIGNVTALNENKEGHQSDIHNCGVFALDYMIRRFKGEGHESIMESNKKFDPIQKRQELISYFLFTGENKDVRFIEVSEEGDMCLIEISDR